jgi:lipid-A-disaccharide synthase
MERERPDVVVPIDYPGFHLRIATWAKAHGRRVVWYIGPQVWAWGADRVPKIAAAVHRMLVVFPFEEELYRGAGLPTDFVGHPLLEAVAEAPSREEARRELGVKDDTPLLGLLAGSRVQEVRRLLPVMVQTAVQARREIAGVQVVASEAGDVPPDEYAAARAADVRLQPGPASTLMAAADALLVTSGTATLESALIGTPLAVLYRTSPATWWVGQRLIKIDRISLVNIVGGGDLVPEFLQGEATPARILPWVKETLGDPAARAATTDRLRALRAQFAGHEASREAARIILEEAVA